MVEINKQGSSSIFMLWLQSTLGAEQVTVAQQLAPEIPTSLAKCSNNTCGFFKTYMDLGTSHVQTPGDNNIYSSLACEAWDLPLYLLSILFVFHLFLCLSLLDRLSQRNVRGEMAH